MRFGFLALAILAIATVSLAAPPPQAPPIDDRLVDIEMRLDVLEQRVTLMEGATKPKTPATKEFPYGRPKCSDTGVVPSGLEGQDEYSRQVFGVSYRYGTGTKSDPYRNTPEVASGATIDTSPADRSVRSVVVQQPQLTATMRSVRTCVNGQCYTRLVPR